MEFRFAPVRCMWWGPLQLPSVLSSISPVPVLLRPAKLLLLLHHRNSIAFQASPQHTPATHRPRQGPARLDSRAQGHASRCYLNCRTHRGIWRWSSTPTKRWCMASHSFDRSPPTTLQQGRRRLSPTPRYLGQFDSHRWQAVTSIGPCRPVGSSRPLPRPAWFLCM